MFFNIFFEFGFDLLVKFWVIVFKVLVVLFCLYVDRDFLYVLSIYVIMSFINIGMMKLWNLVIVLMINLIYGLGLFYVYFFFNEKYFVLKKYVIVFIDKFLRL